MSEREYYVYILASQPNGTLYIGVTNSLAHRIWQHRTGTGSEFASRYSANLLVWYETHSEALQAITREKQLKKWNRRWKLELIEKTNPTWRDLYEELNA
jgi:putative endonuclease